MGDQAPLAPKDDHVATPDARRAVRHQHPVAIAERRRHALPVDGNPVLLSGLRPQTESASMQLAHHLTTSGR